MPFADDGPSGMKSTSRDYKSSGEVKTERRHTTTQDRTQMRTKRPVKESAGAGGRGDYDKPRTKKHASGDSSSPFGKPDEKEQLAGQQKSSETEEVFHRANI